MPRIAGVDIPKEKRIEIALTYIYGIGRSRSRDILAAIGVDPDIRAHQLSDPQLQQLRQKIEEDYKVEGALKAEERRNIKRLMEIGCYRGTRHKKDLPVRGQRTRTNARTRKGPRKTVAGRKTATTKK